MALGSSLLVIFYPMCTSRVVKLTFGTRLRLSLHLGWQIYERGVQVNVTAAEVRRDGGKEWWRAVCVV